MRKTFAIVVKKEGDAVSASAEEGNTAITQYLKTLDDYIPFADDGDPNPEDLYNDDNCNLAQPAGLPQSSAPTQSYAPPQQYGSQQPYAPPQSQELSSPPISYEDLAPRYTSGGESYRDSIAARPSAPFVDNPPRVGSHSATLPVYPRTSAYRRGSEGSKTYNPLQSRDP